MPTASLHAGAAQLDITPPLGVEMCGYGPYEKRICTEVLDPLFARALWLEAAGERVLLLTVDLCAIDGAMRDAVAAELSARCGIDPRNIMIAASHTHSGPAAQWLIGWGERDPAYMAQLPGLLARVGVQACKTAEPARLGAGRVRVREVGVNREQPALGPLDTAAQLLRVDRAGDGTPLAAALNFGAHGVTRYPFTSRLSADWPGLLAAYLSHELGGAIVLFLQGPCGNINGHIMTFDRGDVTRLQQLCDMRCGDTAIRLGEQVLPALRHLPTAGDAALGASWKTITLPCVAPDRAELERLIEDSLPVAQRMTLADLRPLYQRLADETPGEIAWRQARCAVDSARHYLALLDREEFTVAAPVQVLRLGEAALVGWPGEIFVELGLELRQRSPLPLTFVASFANANVGYIPTPAAYESQGHPHQFGLYPVALTPRIYGRLPFRADVGRLLVEETFAELVAQ